MTDLIERAKAVAERLDVGTVIFREPDNFATYTDTDGIQLRVNLGGSVLTQKTFDGTEEAAIIRELIAQVEARNLLIPES